jgi:hypothetical protein
MTHESFDPIKFIDIYDALRQYDIIEDNVFKSDVVRIVWEHHDGCNTMPELIIRVKNLAYPDACWNTIFRVERCSCKVHRVRGPWDVALHEIYSHLCEAIKRKQDEAKRKADEEVAANQAFIDAWEAYVKGLKNFQSTLEGRA